MTIFTWKQRVIVLSVTVGMIGLFALMGYLVGSAAGNWKLGIGVGALLSYPFTQFSLLKAMRTMHPPKKIDEQTEMN